MQGVSQEVLEQYGAERLEQFFTVGPGNPIKRGIYARRSGDRTGDLDLKQHYNRVRDGEFTLVEVCDDEALNRRAQGKA